MANITKRINKAGETSYLIRVFIEQGPDGKQTTKSMTWKPPANMRPTAADKQARNEAALFEQRARSGVVAIDGKISFADYAARWMDAAELAPKTREQYGFLLKRINASLGHVSLEKLRIDHLQRFYKGLREEGAKSGGRTAVSVCLNERRASLGLTQRHLSELSGVSTASIVAAGKGKRIAQTTALKLCAAMDAKPEDLFTFQTEPARLSERTIWHHHKVIRAMLASATKARIVPHNVTDFMDAPKLPRTEARYLTDEEAKAFLAALMDEQDIRIKTALVLDLFTGVRLGELCGLSWPDIDFKAATVHVRRASQYVIGRGIIEVPTKTAGSTRSITVSSFVMTALADYKAWWLEQKLMHGDAWSGERERLFIQSGGKPIFPSTINTWLARFIQKNNLPRISPHSLRHTFITLQITAGVDIRTLQARSGHSQASTLLNVYSHAIQSAQERAAQVMDSVLLPEPTEN